MAQIRFDVRHHFDQPPEVVWNELVDWSRHGDWIPATTIEIGPGDPTDVGREFTALTGFGRVALPDRMRVVTCEWDPERSTGDCVVDKLGPVLRGQAGFTVEADRDGAVIDWFEDVSIPYVPQLVAPLGGRIGAFFFRQGMRKLAKNLGS